VSKDDSTSTFDDDFDPSKADFDMILLIHDYALRAH
jgi:hypothetical protein